LGLARMLGQPWSAANRWPDGAVLRLSGVRGFSVELLAFTYNHR